RLPRSTAAAPWSLRAAFRPFGRRFAWAGFYFLVLFAIGTAGYVAIEGWEWFDALYMSITTATSVGFMGLYPLSQPRRVLPIVIIVFGTTGLGVWWGLITALIVELDLGGLLRRRRMMRLIERLENHFIIAGAGRMGRVVARELIEAGTPFVVIERDLKKLE